MNNILPDWLGIPLAILIGAAAIGMPIAVLVYKIVKRKK